MFQAKKGYEPSHHDYVEQKMIVRFLCCDVKMTHSVASCVHSHLRTESTGSTASRNERTKLYGACQKQRGFFLVSTQKALHSCAFGIRQLEDIILCLTSRDTLAAAKIGGFPTSSHHINSKTQAQNCATTRSHYCFLMWKPFYHIICC